MSQCGLPFRFWGDKGTWGWGDQRPGKNFQPSGSDDRPFRVLGFNVGWKLQFKQPQKRFFVTRSSQSSQPKFKAFEVRMSIDSFIFFHLSDKNK